jgi:hypothetical protein
VRLLLSTCTHCRGIGRYTRGYVATPTGFEEFDCWRCRGTGKIAKLEVRASLQPRDLWIGVYWTRIDEDLRIYLCPVPVLCIEFRWRRYP